MADAWHCFGGDLSVGPTGDIGCASGADLVQQRLLRRLLTNPGDYVWNPGYGAGLGQFLGRPVDAGRIQAAIRGQVVREAAVARQPEPEIEVAADMAGGVSVQIRYAEAGSGATRNLAFTVSGD
jgi:hypothetical protein